MHQSGWNDEGRYYRNLRGSDTLRTFPSEKVVWQPGNFDFSQIVTSLGLIGWCQQSPWKQIGDQVLAELGFSVPQWSQVERLVESGSSTTSSWIYEDFALMKAVSIVPGSAGIITISGGNAPLSNSLADLVDSFKVLGWARHLEDQLFGCFTEEELVRPPKFVGSHRILRAFVGVGLNAPTRIILQRIEKNFGGFSWLDFVAVQRYVVAQLINLQFGPRVPLTIVDLDDLILLTTEMGSWTLKSYLEELRRAAGFWRESRSVRALNYPCGRCGQWHFLTSKGDFFLEEQKGVHVKKKCWLRPMNDLTIEKVLRRGAGLSGMGLYLAFGEIGKTADWITIARDYSKGRVYEALTSFIENPKNGLRLFPVGAIYLSGTNTRTDWGLWSIVFWEILQRVSDPTRLITEIFENLPVPLAKVEPTVIVISG